MGMRVPNNVGVWSSTVCLLLLPAMSAVCAGEQAGLPGSAFLNERHVYERGETCALRLRVPGAAAVLFDMSGWLPETASLEGDIATYTLDTHALHSGDYVVRGRVQRDGTDEENVCFSLTVAKPHDDERIPVWRWGGGGSDPEWWMRRGFTGAFLAASRDPLEPGGDTAHSTARALERAAEYDFELGLYLHPLLSKTLAENEAVLSLFPDGTRQSDPPKPYPLEPAVMDHARAVADSWLARFHDYPGLRHVMLHSEWQTPFCVNETACTLAEEEAGLNIHDLVEGKGRVKGVGAGEVRDGVIEDDNPRYRFLQWWWQRGHGTAPLNQELHAIVKKHNPALITWHEPYRLAPVRYSHKGLDCIGTWTYGHPDIKRLCYTSYLEAAARPEGQLVHQDITLFLYARFVMPLDDSSADLGQDFAGKDPYFTAGPDFASEGIWIVMAQRPDILCFYSAGRLSPDNPENDPFYASPDTFNAIGQTCEELVKPYGPTIRACRRLAPRVALLMSAASTWFPASPRLPGYPNEQTLPYATLMMMNHVPFDVLLDEDILEGALERYRILVMPKADTLTRGMYEKITAFAEAGGKVIADASLRASIPSAQRTDFDFTHQLRIDGDALAKGNAVTAEENRTIMEGYAATLAPLLAEAPRAADAESPRVLTNSLEGGAARYHFLINDERTYGPRFGQWKLFFELGAPQIAAVSIALEDRPTLYDVLMRKAVTYEEKDGRACFEVRMAGARGKLIVALPEEIGAVKIEAPAETKAGEPVEVTLKVLGASGAVLPAVLPLRIDILDALGRNTEWGRFTATRDGTRAFMFTPAINDALGTWTVRATDLVAGKTAEANMAVM